MASRALTTMGFLAGVLGPLCGVSPTNADDIAMSFVHKQERIDVPRSAVVRIEGFASMRLVTQGTNEYKDYPRPSVQVCFAAEIQKRICDMTRRLVGETIAIVVDCQTVTEPVVREPLCSKSCFSISTFDVAETEALVDKLQNGSATACEEPTS